MQKKIYNQFLETKAKRQKQFAVLIDPDKVTADSLLKTIDLAVKSGVDYFFVGGSLLVNDMLNESIDVIKSSCAIPVIIFPGSASQIKDNADAILFLSLISGRNPELLIGQHVQAAPILKASKLEIISTGYMLIDGGAPTTVSYVSNTTPIPSDKDDIASCTALAGEMLGLKIIYLDAGSGAKNHVTTSMVKNISSQINIPLIVGGGIRDAKTAKEICNAGADIIVVGNAIEKNDALIESISRAIHSNVVGVSPHHT